MTTERERLQIADELQGMIEQMKEETLPDYDPATEITIGDLEKKLGCSRSRVERMIEEKEKSGQLRFRYVILPTGQRAKAYRPAEK